MGRLEGCDARRWDEFFVRHERALTAYAVALSADPDVAEDLVQEALLRSMAGRRPVNRELPFVLLCIRNAWIDRYRRALVRGQKREATPDLVAPVDASLGDDDQREWAIRVKEAVAALPSDRREVVVLKVWSGLTLRQVAQVLNRPLGTVSSLYTRALRELRASLARELTG